MPKRDHQPIVTGQRAGGNFLFLVDHASPLVPDGLGGLGLPASELQRHIGWDIGAADLARGLADALASPAVYAPVSRLVVDPNREPDDAEVIPPVSDGTVIPANKALDGAGRKRRIARCHEPFHEAAGKLVVEMMAGGRQPFVVGIHSFAPMMNGGAPRPWHIGVMWNEDRRLSEPLVSHLKGEGFTVGENEPYSGRAPENVFYTMTRHGAGNGLPHTQIEVRQDMLADRQGIKAWVGILSGALRRMEAVVA